MNKFYRLDDYTAEDPDMDELDPSKNPEDTEDNPLSPNQKKAGVEIIDPEDEDNLDGEEDTSDEDDDDSEESPEESF